MSEKLKPEDCPFCDFQFLQAKERGDSLRFCETTDGLQLICPNCGACGPDWLCEYMSGTRDQEEAVKAWNTRILEKPKPEDNPEIKI